MPHKSGHLNYHLHLTHRGGGGYQNWGGGKFVTTTYVFACRKIVILWSDCESWRKANVTAIPLAQPSLIHYETQNSLVTNVRFS